MNENNNQNENGFEAYIDREFQEEVPSEVPKDLKNEKSGMRVYFMYAFVFTMILIVFGITSTYAFYVMQVSSDSFSTTAVTVQAECFDVTLKDASGNVSSGQSSTLSLGDYNYPITDDFAETEGKLTPMTIEVKNNCTASGINKTAVPYKLFLSTFTKDSSSGTQVKDIIPDSKMKIRVMKGETELKAASLISNLTPFTATSGGKIDFNELLNKAISEQGTTKGLTLSQNYIIDGDSTIAPGTTNTYKIYVWVDYYEGCSKETATNDGCNGSTKDKEFKAIVSAIIN